MIDIVGNGVFYGRYWGCLPEYDIKNLHFEVCYWSAIEYCINNGYKRMEPGAGGGGTYFVVVIVVVVHILPVYLNIYFLFTNLYNKSKLFCIF